MTPVQVTGDPERAARHIAGELGIGTFQAECLPEDKLTWIDRSQQSGHLVCMVGDGINDAPALRRADVGFAMGSGTQVAKDAGDIVILDNRLSSIVRAVLYGRTVFKSIRKFITLQLTMNFSAVGVTMICPFLGIDSPVTVIQMLWINLIMDTFAALALATEPPDPTVMNLPPRSPRAFIVTPAMAWNIFGTAAFFLICVLGFLLCSRSA